MLIKRAFNRIKRIIVGANGSVQGVPPALKISNNFLEDARVSLGDGDFSSALKLYFLAKNENSKNLEIYIGMTLCYLNLHQRDEALKILQFSNRDFGDHDAILGLLTKFYLDEKSWGDVEGYWVRWQEAFLAEKTLNFYQISGEILVSLAKTENFGGDFSKMLIQNLVYQSDKSVDAKSHPVICSLLFQQHEYDRPLYLRLLREVRLFLDQPQSEELRPTLCTATMLVSFGLVDAEERRRILRDNFHDFELYSHWSFILLGSSWNAIWDESLKLNAESIPILKQILHGIALDTCDSEQIYKIIFVANICARDLTSELMGCAQQLLDSGADIGDVRDDLRFIVDESKNPSDRQQHNKPQRLKIAVCVSGQLRGWQTAFNSWSRIGLAEHDVTYIVHTWKDTGGGYPIPPKDERALPVNFQSQYRKVWNQLGAEEMLSRYAKFFSLWPRNGADIDLNDLRQVYGTDHVYIDDGLLEPFRGFSNSEKMYYKIWGCQQEVDRLDVDFDLIVRIRPDLEFIESKEVNWFAIYEACALRNVLFCESYATYFFPNIGYCMPDQFAIGSPHAMRGYASAYAMTKKYPTSHGGYLSHFPEDFVAHRNVAYSTLYNGIEVNSIGLPCRFSPVFKPSKEMIAEAIIQDSKGRNDAFDHLLLESLK